MGTLRCFSFQFLVVAACSCSQSFIYSRWPNSLSTTSRLVVPTLRRSVSAPTPASVVVDEHASRSGVWAHFAKNTKTGDEKQTATCNACGKRFVYNGLTTSNLLEHWKNQHAKQLPAAQSTLIKLFSAKPSSAKVSSAATQEVTKLLASWCWTNLRPPNIVRDEGLMFAL